MALCEPLIEAMSTTSSANARRATILVVDDSPDVVFVISHVLEGAGHDVLSAYSVAAGMEQIAVSPRVDLALCDLRLPDGDGLALVRAVQARFPSAPAFLLTGMALEPSEVPAGVSVLRKPVGIDELENVVARALAGLAV